MRTLNWLCTISICLGLLSTTGCQEAADAEAGEESSLPAMVESADEEPPPAPSLCTWTSSVDAVVWGELEELRIADEPLIGSDDEGLWEWRDHCAGPVNTAMEMDVAVQNSPSGSVESETITVRVGFDQKTMFQPSPVEQDGELTWLGDEDKALVEGQMLGMAVHWIDDHEAWSLMGEPLFGTDEEGMIAFQERGGEAVEPAPELVEAMNIETFADEVAGCEPTDDVERRNEYVDQHWAPGENRLPTRYIAARCLPQ